MNTKTLCLGVLTLGASSGYDIRKHLEENFGHFMDVSSNAVYPALKALEKENMVSFQTITQQNYPDKKIYTLTDEGKKYWLEQLQVLPPRHKVRSQLMLLMFFADSLTGARMDEVMQERLEELTHWTNVCEEWLDSAESEMAGVGPHFLVDYALAIMEAEIKFINKNTDKLVKQLDDRDGKKK